MYIRKSRQLGGILLVSGTTIGAGMLALPVVTAQAGFYPSLFLFLFYWAMSVATALLLLEVNLWFDEKVNLITMARYTLGKKGAVVAWILYLMLLYALLAAYLAAGGQIVHDCAGWMGLFLSSWASSLLFLLIFGSFILFGTRPVDYANRLLMAALFVSYVCILYFSEADVQKDRLLHICLPCLAGAVPIVATSFGFHIVIPSLTFYLHKDPKILKRVILIGSFVPLLVYLIWEYVVLASVPFSDLQEAYAKGEALNLLQSPTMRVAASFFSSFAVITSFLGVGLSLMHFLADGLRIHSKGKTAFLTFLPPLFFTLVYPKAFIKALDLAGIFVALLLGILPCWMAWEGRKVHQGNILYRVRGGSSLLFTLFLGYLFVIISVLL